MSKTRTLARLLSVLLELFTTATALFTLAGVPLQTVVEAALPWLRWLANGTARNVLGHYR